MNKLLSVVLALGMASICLPADEHGTANIAGEWQMSLVSPRRTIAGPLKIQQEGSKITGTFESEHAGNLTLTGKVEGNKLTFNMEPHAGMTLTFNGAVEGDKMSGTTDPASGSWSASRKKDIETGNEAERADWEKRGLSGVVAEKTGDEIIARQAGDVTSTITVTPQTRFRRDP